MHILDKIVQYKYREVAERKELTPVKLLEKSLYYRSPVVSLVSTLKRSDKVGIIAEFKKRSPSKPIINPYADIEHVSIGYMMAGSSALSVLTDEHFFGGSSQDLTTARKFNYCPILRKDFIVDEYQIVEARSMGADVILLIAEILQKAKLYELASLAKSLGLEVLMEIHSEEQLKKLNDHIDLIGVNNRDLSTFTVDHGHSLRLFDALPKEVVKISESGIHDVNTIIQLRNCGYQGFLIGERFMSQPDPVKACRKFIQSLQDELNASATKNSKEEVSVS